jgi:hypothetical protein
LRTAQLRNQQGPSPAPDARQHAGVVVRYASRVAARQAVQRAVQAAKQAELRDRHPAASVESGRSVSPGCTPPGQAQNGGEVTRRARRVSPVGQLQRAPAVAHQPPPRCGGGNLALQPAGKRGSTSSTVAAIPGLRRPLPGFLLACPCRRCTWTCTCTSTSTTAAK